MSNPHLLPLLPLLGITLGDPAGIGPEVALKALQHADIYDWCNPFVIGDIRVLQRAAHNLGIANLQDLHCFNVITAPSRQLASSARQINVLDLANADPAACPIGKVSAAAGKAAVEYAFAGCDLALAGAIDGIVTAPLNKAAMNAAGYAYPGHTELLAERTGAGKVTMLLVGPQLRVVHVSMHVGLEEAIRRVTTARVGEVIDLAQQACRALGIPQPRIAVAGLNPHASEGGLFGNQEATQVLPAIQAARARGLVVTDPQPPDTVFLRAVKGEFDIVIAMYHDQGHIPMKLLAFDSGVNVSIGLPIIRTSVDHGTAFDIAGKNLASENSMIEALRVAAQMAVAKAAERAA